MKISSRPLENGCDGKKFHNVQMETGTGGTLQVISAAIGTGSRSSVAGTVSILSWQGDGSAMRSNRACDAARSVAAADKASTAQQNKLEMICFIATARLFAWAFRVRPGRMPKDLSDKYGRYFALQHTFSI
jgi:hypothetical protein